jgi:FMNH2-dependent dimethyl sulfone monooxygenase
MNQKSHYRGFGSNHFELGIFASNVQNGMARLTNVLWSSTWEDNVRLAKLAEEAGFEFLLPIGLWRSRRDFPSEGEQSGGAFETLVWATGTLAVTNRIAVFGTLHVAYINPVFAAKQIVTAHHIGLGRFGLNIVSGTAAKDFAMLGLTPNDHDTQYDYTEEWVTIVKRIWSESAPFDHTGTYFDLQQVLGKPKPYGGKRPMLISAGHSNRGRAFAMVHADALFTSITELENAPEEIRMARATTAGGAEIPIYGSCHFVCRPTRKEAQEYYHHLVYDLGDWDGIDAWVANGMKNRTMSYASIERYKERQISGLGTCLISGSYDDAAQMFKQLHDAGLNGMAVGLIDYLNDATAFRDEVMPRLEHLGLRSDKAFIASQLHTGRSNLRPSHSD